MSNWNAAHYLKYGDERTRAAIDLAARINLDSPSLIADLGCGPGNSTQVLHQRWPNAEIVGIDRSVDMIQAARLSYPEQRWEQADVSDWQPAHSFDLIYSNAALQWIPDHAALIPQLFKQVGLKGALAFQIPSNSFATVRTLIHEISHATQWTDRMEQARQALTMEAPSFYYDVLAETASELDLWETEYNHVLNSPDKIVDWIASTGLRPFLAALNTKQEREEFVAALQERVDDAYPPRIDGKVLFPFRRTFVIAYR